MVNYEKEGDLEIHLADVGGYHQRHSDEPGSIELPGMRENKSGGDLSQAPTTKKKLKLEINKIIVSLSYDHEGYKFHVSMDGPPACGHQR